jgi:hypothetical protein
MLLPMGNSHGVWEGRQSIVDQRELIGRHDGRQPDLLRYPQARAGDLECEELASQAHANLMRQIRRDVVRVAEHDVAPAERIEALPRERVGQQVAQAVVGELAVEDETPVEIVLFREAAIHASRVVVQIALGGRAASTRWSLWLWLRKRGRRAPENYGVTAAVYGSQIVNDHVLRRT